MGKKNILNQTKGTIFLVQSRTVIDQYKPSIFFFCWFYFSALLPMVQKKEIEGMVHTVKDWCHVITQFSIQI